MEELDLEKLNREKFLFLIMCLLSVLMAVMSIIVYQYAYNCAYAKTVMEGSPSGCGTRTIILGYPYREHAWIYALPPALTALIFFAYAYRLSKNQKGA